MVKNNRPRLSTKMERIYKMEQEKNFEGTTPDYKGDGISIWKNEISKGDNKGETYLSVKVLGGKSVACFKFVPQEKKKDL